MLQDGELIVSSTHRAAASGASGWSAARWLVLGQSWVVDSRDVAMLEGGAEA